MRADVEVTGERWEENQTAVGREVISMSGFSPGCIMLFDRHTLRPGAEK
jgi:hypothetical protein